MQIDSRQQAELAKRHTSPTRGDRGYSTGTFASGNRETYHTQLPHRLEEKPVTRNRFGTMKQLGSQVPAAIIEESVRAGNMIMTAEDYDKELGRVRR